MEPEKRDSIVHTRCRADTELEDKVRSRLRLGGGSFVIRPPTLTWRCLARQIHAMLAPLLNHAKWLTEAYLAAQRGENLQGRAH